MRENITFAITDGPHTYSASGRVYVTSTRLCFQEHGMTTPSGRPLLHNLTGKEWAAFDVPLQLVTFHAFKQPIFGCNYLEGEVVSVEGGGFREEVLKWRIGFTRGGVGTFLRLFFFRLMKFVGARVSSLGTARKY